MRKRSPTHPGAILREDVFPALGITVSELANRLGISRQTLHSVLAEKSSITPELALRIGTFLGNGPHLWIEKQSKYNLWQAELKLKKVLPKITLFKNNLGVQPR
ncbi:MAG: HigA family addiction module antidote protein [Betaproteobacteria bacterium]|nr:HigA family addiction module antidote protein [Betaproteobacteria bacterium]